MDYIIIPAESETNLRDILNHLEEVMLEYWMKLNKKKTKEIQCVKNRSRGMNIMLEGIKLEEADDFCYLGSMITKNKNCCKCDVKSKISLSKKEFGGKRLLLTKSIDIEVKLHFLEAFVYRCEMWGISEEDISNRSIQNVVLQKIGEGYCPHSSNKKLVNNTYEKETIQKRNYILVTL